MTRATCLEDAVEELARRGLEPLTERQAKILRFIVAHEREHRLPPSLREIGKHMEINSTNGVSDHLAALERKGYVRRDAMKSRAITALFDEHGNELVSASPEAVLRLRQRVAELEAQVNSARAEGAIEEREACAMIARTRARREFSGIEQKGARDEAAAIEAAIRARGAA